MGVAEVVAVETAPEAGGGKSLSGSTISVVKPPKGNGLPHLYDRLFAGKIIVTQRQPSCSVRSGHCRKCDSVFNKCSRAIADASI